MPPTTTKSATGLFLRNTLPSTSTARAASPILREEALVSCRWLRKCRLFSQKSPCAPWNPNNLGSWVLARNSATPHLKPVMTLSEMKFTMAPALANQARKAMPATSSAVAAASAPNRASSPPAISPSVAPMSSEMAEVTVITVCLELQSSQKTRPPKRQA